MITGTVSFLTNDLVFLFQKSLIKKNLNSKKLRAGVITRYRVMEFVKEFGQLLREVITRLCCRGVIVVLVMYSLQNRRLASMIAAKQTVHDTRISTWLLTGLWNLLLLSIGILKNVLSYTLVSLFLPVIRFLWNFIFVPMVSRVQENQFMWRQSLCSWNLLHTWVFF